MEKSQISGLSMLEGQFQDRSVREHTCPTLTMSWVKEVERATSIANLMTSQSIEGKVFLIFEMLDAKVASALKKIISNSNF